MSVSNLRCRSLRQLLWRRELRLSTTAALSPTPPLHHLSRRWWRYCLQHGCFGEWHGSFGEWSGRIRCCLRDRKRLDNSWLNNSRLDWRCFDGYWPLWPPLWWCRGSCLHRQSCLGYLNGLRHPIARIRRVSDGRQLTISRSLCVVQHHRFDRPRVRIVVGIRPRPL